MNKKELLNEENYQKTNNKIKLISLIILIIGLLIGGSVIATGIIKQSKINLKYSEENQQNISNLIEKEKQNLENKRLELEAKGIKFDSFTEYTDGETYDLKIITNVLNPSYNRCVFDEYKNNSLTSKYCSLKSELEEVSSDFNKSFDSHDSIPFYMFGAFAIISTCMIAGAVYITSKRREITAYTTQQFMPVAQESMEKIAPTIGKAGASIAKEVAPVYKDIVKEISPLYGNIAKEISKGIKEGINEADKNK